MSFSNGSALVAGQKIQLAAFYLGDQLMAVDIHQVQEINRHVTTTPVPHAPDYVRGVVNLRGEVVTVLDLRAVLGMGPTTLTKDSRNVIVNWQGEKNGLLVDRVADVVTTDTNDIDHPPANVNGMDACFFQGVVKLEHDLLVVLDVPSILSGRTSSEVTESGEGTPTAVASTSRS